MTSEKINLKIIIIIMAINRIFIIIKMVIEIIIIDII
jgi:hypothetical protein